MTALHLPGRLRTRERMETEEVSGEDLARCLADLERLTERGRGHAPTLAWLARIARGRRELSVLDVGSGGGNMLRRIAAWAEGADIAVRLTGLDLDPLARNAAEAATDPRLPIRFVSGDVFDYAPPEAVDVVISLHMAHHLDDADLVRFLCWMDATARVGWFVNDLHRHALAFWTLRGLLPLSGYHRFVVSDGPVSIRRAFVRSDWERAIAAAGLDPERIEIAWHWPFRWGVGTRPEPAR